eukprot:5773484-Alexandrium_andersonii.AAC.1
MAQAMPPVVQRPSRNAVEQLQYEWVAVVGWQRSARTRVRACVRARARVCSGHCLLAGRRPVRVLPCSRCSTAESTPP